MEQLYIDVDKLLEEEDDAYGRRSAYQEALDTQAAGGQDNVPFPIRSILLLYMRSNHADLYTNYYKGLRLLVWWLGPIELPLKNIPYAKLPLALGNWEVHELAKILKCSEELVFYTILSIHIEGTGRVII